MKDKGEENNTEAIYEKIKSELGKDWNRGYSTDEKEDSDDDANMEIEDDEPEAEVVNLAELDKYCPVNI